MNIDLFQQFKAILPWLYLYIGLATLLILCVDVVRRYYNLRYLLNQKTVVLELTPPAFTMKSPVATEHLFSVLHALGNRRSWREKLLGRNRIFSLEVVSSRSQGIRYLVRLPEADAAVFQQQLAAYLPDVRFQAVEDYLAPALEGERPIQLMEFKQVKHFAYPLANHASLSEHDPIAYIAGSMTKLAPDELIAFQVVLAPVAPREVRRIRAKLMIGRDPGLHSKSGTLYKRALRLLLLLPIGVLRLLTGMMTEITRPRGELPSRPYPPSNTVTIQTPVAQAHLTSLHGKLAQPLFQTSIRILVITDNPERSRQSIAGLGAALMAFSVPGYQGLVSKRSFPRKLISRYRLYSFTKRLPSQLSSNSCVLAVSETAALYHFPYAYTSQTENVIKSHSRTLPAPVSLKQNTTFDLVLGRNHHHGSETSIGLTEKERERHIYIIGGTGNGKTTMLQFGVVQDMYSGKGLAVVDPHGDMAETLLRQVPEHRIKDVIYFNPDDLDHPIGLNLLELTPGLTGNALLREKDIITESVVSIFRKIFSEEDSGGHRIEYVLRNAIHTALTVEGATLFTVLKLLQNAPYRKKITDKLEDEDLKDFWKSELGQAGNMQRVKMSAGITAKIGRFKSNAAASLILSQEKSTIDFEDIINSSKILICNFSKGLLGEDVSELFGITILAKLQLASLRRARIQQAERRPFYLYVDEFQNFATASFVQMLSEARKYKLFMTMAEQSTSQQKDQQMVNIILANVGTVVCFRTGNPADEKLMLPLFSPYIDEGEIANLSAYNFYAKLSSLQAQEPMSGQTVLLDRTGSAAVAEQAIEWTQQSYGRAVELPDDDKVVVAPKKKRAKKKQEKDELHDEFPEET